MPVLVGQDGELPDAFHCHIPILNGDMTIFCLMAGGCKATIADVIAFDEFLSSSNSIVRKPLHLFSGCGL